MGAQPQQKRFNKRPRGPGVSTVLGWLTTFKQKPLHQSYYFLYSKSNLFLATTILFRYSLKKKNRTILDLRLQFNLQSQFWAIRGRQLSFLACNLFWLFLSLKLQIELSGIHGSQNVSYLKSQVSHYRREAEKIGETRCGTPLLCCLVTSNNLIMIMIMICSAKAI